MTKNVLIIVDYQRDFVDGALGFKDAKRLDDDILGLTKKYMKDKDGIIIVTFDSHEDNYLETLEGKKLPIKHCIRNSDGHELYGKTGEYIRGLYSTVSQYIGKHDTCVYTTDNDKVYLVTKNTFGSIELGEFLRSINSSIENIDIVGIVTNMCVISNAVVAKSACPNAEINIKSSLVSSFDGNLHKKALEVMAGMQMNVQ